MKQSNKEVEIVYIKKDIKVIKKCYTNLEKSWTWYNLE